MKRVMRIERNNPKRFRADSAFSMAETIVAVAAFAIMFASFFGGLSLSISMVQSARETVRATQIMSEQMDTLRLKRWDQIDTLNNTTYYPSFNPISSNVPNSGAAGLTYTAQVSVINGSAFITNGESYQTNVKQVTIQLTWKSRNLLRKTEMTTFVSQYGLQTYIP